MNDTELTIGGLTRFTTIDFPGRLAAVLFCQGCSFRCSYCHNKHLQPVSSDEKIQWDEVIEFLNSRRNRLEGVIISGGEPLIQKNLTSAIRSIKQLGFEVGMHTAGTSYKKFAEALPYLSWVGFDIKTNFENYKKVTGCDKNIQNIQDSLNLLLDSQTDYEIRTTIDPHSISKDELLKLAQQMSRKGVKRYVLQEYRPIGRESEPTTEEIKEILLDDDFINSLSKMFPSFEVRKS